MSESKHMPRTIVASTRGHPGSYPLQADSTCEIVEERRVLRPQEPSRRTRTHRQHPAVLALAPLEIVPKRGEPPLHRKAQLPMLQVLMSAEGR